ncbi:MAG TPA: hypothetical protein VF384_10195 [Planctomycetota bacterium]
MAGRMSNRERIERLRAEADAAAREKAAARAAKAGRATTPKAAASARGRVRIVWSVFDPTGKEVKSFPYAQEAEARAAAAELTASTGRPHYVAQADVPFG